MEALSIGTIIEILSSIFSPVLGFLRKPNIQIGYDEEELKIIKNNDCRIYLKISNIGKTTANNVRVKILEVVQNGNNLIRPNARMFILDVDSLPSGDYNVQIFLMFSRVEGKEMRVYAFHKKGVEPIYTGMYIPKQDTRFKLLVSGDNISAFQVIYDFIDSENYTQMTLRRM